MCQTKKRRLQRSSNILKGLVNSGAWAPDVTNLVRVQASQPNLHVSIQGPYHQPIRVEFSHFWLLSHAQTDLAEPCHSYRRGSNTPKRSLRIGSLFMGITKGGVTAR